MFTNEELKILLNIIEDKQKRIKSHLKKLAEKRMVSSGEYKKKIEYYIDLKIKQWNELKSLHTKIKEKIR